MIEIQNITKIYRKGNETFTALDDVTLKIDIGDFAAVIGPSGSGKSTLLNSIGGLIKPDSGRVLYKGNDIYNLPANMLDDYRKKNTGFVFQQFHLMPYLTVYENIRLACLDGSHQDSINEYLEKCSIAALKNKYPSELSVGEKQRTAFIRAIISEPEILLADEPTGNLDPMNSSILMALVEDFHKKGGTVLLVSHDPEAAKYADRYIKLEAGRLLND